MGVRPYRIAAALVLAVAVTLATAASAFAGAVTIVGMTEFGNNFSTPEDTPFDLVLTATDITPSHLPTMSWYLPFGSVGLTTEPDPSSKTGPIYTLHYNPPANFNSGLFELAQVYAFDTAGNGHWIHINMAVTSVPDAPVVAEGPVLAISTNEDTTKSLSLHGSDGDGDALTWWVSSAPVHGDVTTATAGGGATLNLEYTPDANANGSDPFEVSVSDGTHVTTCVVDMAVAAVNDWPTIDQGALMAIDVTEDTPYSFQLTATDVDGQPLAWWTAWEPSGGTLAMEPADSGATLNVTYTPDENFNGPDMFELVVTDGAAIDVIDVTVGVAPVNDPPTASSDYPIGDEDTTIIGNVIDNDVDADGDALYVHTFEGDAIPFMGSVVRFLPEGTVKVWWDGWYEFTPAPDGFGTFEYTVWVADGMYVAPSTLSFSVAPVNDAPVIFEGSSYPLTTDEDTQSQFVLTAGDVEGDTVEWSVSSEPLNGSVTIDAWGGMLEVFYTPDENFNGSDPFEISVSDGVDSTVMAVDVTVDAMNDPLEISSDTTTAVEDTTIYGNVIDNDFDVDGDGLFVHSLGGFGWIPPGGSITEIHPLGTITMHWDGRYTFVPLPDASGFATFEVWVADGYWVGPGQLDITVTPVNDAPVIGEGSLKVLTTGEDTPGGFELTATDVDGDPLAWGVSSNATDGTVDIVEAPLGASCTVTYTPDANFNGSDSFEITVGDGALEATIALQVTVTAVNDTPVALTDEYSVDEDGMLDVAAPGVMGDDSDVESDTLTCIGETYPAHGDLFLYEDGSLVYLPDTDYAGPDSFTYYVSDGTADSLPATVDITVVAVNDEPVGLALSNDAVAENAAADTLVGTVSATDIDSDPLTYSLIGEGADDFAISGNELRTTRAFDYETDNSFGVTVRVDDGDGGVVDKPFSISITDVNEPPLVSGESLSIAEETVLTGDVSLNDSDPESGALTFAVATGPANAADFALGETGAFTYTPALDYNGTDSFTYTVTDGLHTVEGTVDINVTGVNDMPVAADDAYETFEDVGLSIPAPGVLENDDDADGDTLTPAVETAPANGEVELASDGAFVYTPAAGWSGTDEFAYAVSDGDVTSTAATVTITVHAVDTAFTPVAGGDRIGTSIAVCTQAFPGDATADTVVLATSRNWPDALGGSALAGAVNGPILLTGRDSVSGEVIAEIKRLKATNAYVLGGENAISNAVMEQLDAELEGDVVRLGGASRYETAAMVASETVSITGGADGVAFLAKGTNFADALAASSLAAYKSWPIYLSAADDLTDVTEAAMTAAGIDQVVILGGDGAIAPEVEDELTTLGFGTRRLSGGDRYATGVAVAEYGVEIGLGWDGMALATGQNFPDGLSGGVLAARNGAVMLLNPTSTLHSAVRDVVSANRSSITCLYYIGGSNAISLNVRNDIAALLR